MNAAAPSLLDGAYVFAIADGAALGPDVVATVRRALAALPTTEARHVAVLWRPGKDWPGDALVPAMDLREITRACGAAFLVSADADAARRVGADGLHLPSWCDARAAASWGERFGRSCHDVAELSSACREGASWAFLSPLFRSASHPGEPALGPERWRQIASCRVHPVPRLIALGGIDPRRVAQAVTSGAEGVAAVRAAWDGQLHALVRAFQAASRQPA